MEPCSQDLACEYYPEPHESSPHSHTLLLKILELIIRITSTNDNKHPLFKNVSFRNYTDIKCAKSTSV
jgi:hypothetical protein